MNEENKQTTNPAEPSVPDPAAFPFYGYIFDVPSDHPSGCKHRGKIVLLNPKILAEWVIETATPSIIQEIEVMITDRDDYCIFHAKGGKIIFPPEEIGGSSTDFPNPADYGISDPLEAYRKTIEDPETVERLKNEYFVFAKTGNFPSVREVDEESKPDPGEVLIRSPSDPEEK